MGDHNHQEYEIYGLGTKIWNDTSGLRAHIADLNGKIGDLHAINDEMQDEINDLRDRIEELEGGITARLNEHRDRTNEIYKWLDMFEKKIGDNRGEIHAIKCKMD